MSKTKTVATRKRTSSKKQANAQAGLVTREVTPFGLSDIDSQFLFEPEEETPKIHNTEIISEIRSYLENPTKCGIWYFEARLNQDAGISQFIWAELEKKLKRKNIITLQSGNKKTRIELTDEQKKAFRERIFSKLTFVTSLFAHLRRLDNQTLTVSGYPGHWTRNDQVIFDLLNLEKLKKNYAEAYDYFNKEIYFEGFDPVIRTERPFEIRGGALIALDAVSKDNFSFFSTDRDPLERFRIFLNQLQRVSNDSIYPIFSPEETVFAPYFVLLNISFPFIVGDKHNINLFQRAFSEYKSNAFTNCVSTIGLVAEDYLTQIYETLFRDVCPKGLTLGQIYDLVHNAIGRKFQSEPKTLSDLTPFYNQIKVLLEGLESSPNEPINKNILVLLRQVLNATKQDREYYQHALSSLNKKPEALSCFPKYLKENLIELIRYRNAASHKTRIPIGPYEALRTVYCLISLYLWWDGEKRLIDWAEEQDSVLKKVIERNSKIQMK